MITIQGLSGNCDGGVLGIYANNACVGYIDISGPHAGRYSRYWCRVRAGNGKH